MTTIAALVLLTAYYTAPDHPGRHWDCSKPDAVVEYENDQVIILCGAITQTKVKRQSLRQGPYTRWEIVDPSGVLVKGEVGNTRTQAEIDAIALAQLQDPFYDSGEKKLVKWKWIALGADAVTTAYGIRLGPCMEGGLFRKVPGLGLLIAVDDVMRTRHQAKKSPRFFTVSRYKATWAPVATHGAAAVNNLFRCVL